MLILARSNPLFITSVSMELINMAFEKSNDWIFVNLLYREILDENVNTLLNVTLIFLSPIFSYLQFWLYFMVKFH